MSVFDLFKIGIGPSSSHTVGPMRAALMFAQGLERDGLLDAVASVKCELYGSLGATGKGHGTDRGVMLGLMGDAPDTVDARTIVPRLEAVRTSKTLALLEKHAIPFTLKENLAFYRQALPEHPNGMKLHAFDANGALLREATYLSVGGGFVVTAGAANTVVLTAHEQLPYPFQTGDELIAPLDLKRPGQVPFRFRIADAVPARDAILHHIPDAQQPGANFLVAAPDALIVPHQLRDRLARLRAHRAPQLYKVLAGKPEQALRDPLSMIDWINLYAIAVNEENAVAAVS
ncbi:L-serine dehydratase [Candidatus Paraburkholderia kirkii]|nr:L-serine dehydratase [Candidatus Paraburkholderia kirkii]